MNNNNTDILVEYKPISNITPSEIKSFSKLHFKGKGILWSKFNEVKHYEKNVYVFIAKIKSKIIGWALVYKEGDWTILIYVKKACRRLGVGSKIVKLIKKKFKKSNFFVFKHDSISTLFYDKVKL